MPSKIQLDVNLWFLYICLQKSDYKTIDFNAVGSVANLNPPAARMRFTRLKKQIESGSLATTQGTQEAPTPPKKTKSSKAGSKGARKERKKEPDTKADMFKQEPAAGYNDLNEIPEVEELDFPIKMEMDENGEFGDSFGLTRLYGEGPGAEESDEDIPLAKKRKMASALLGLANPPMKESMESDGHREMVPRNHGQAKEVMRPPPGPPRNLTPWGPVGPAGMGKKGGRPATYDVNKLGPPIEDSPKGLGPFPTIMSDNPPFPCDNVIKNGRLCDPAIPAIKVTDLDADKPTKDCTKEPQHTFGTVEERINNDLFGPKNAHLWLPKKRDPVITLPEGKTRMDVPVIALIEEHERRFGNGKK